MISVSIKSLAGLDSLKEKISALSSSDPMLRRVATNVRAALKVRVHVDGLDSAGSPIGTYSAAYMKKRTGNFGNSDKVTRGPKKGKNKNAGTFTDRVIQLNKQSGIFTGEDKVGKNRPNYNRTDDTKVVASLTRQMENDEVIIANENSNSYAIGFTNVENFRKAGYVEATYNKKIFSTTDAEKKLAIDTANEYVKEVLNG